VAIVALFGCGDGDGGGGASNPDAAVAAIDARDVHAPPPSAGHSLVWAGDLERVLLVNAGLGTSSLPPESTPTRLWAWDGASWQLVDSSGPPIRHLAAVAYDSRRHALVMHGGSHDGDTLYGETWEWTMAAGWRSLPAPGPGARDHTMMAFDAERGRMVLFGGGVPPSTLFGDTWEHDGGAWQRVATSGPAARVHHAMAYDTTSKRVVVLGGVTLTATLRDTWAWTGVEWTRLADAPAPRSHARMDHHSGLGGLVVVGAGEGPIATLALREGQWTPVTASPEPRGRCLPGVAFDARRGVLVMFGGCDPRTNAVLGDTWELDAAMWRSVP
jgi:hypothetical protein